MSKVSIKNQTINYTIEFDGNVYNLYYFEDDGGYAEELTEATTGLPVIDEDEFEAVMEFFADNQPNTFG